MPLSLFVYFNIFDKYGNANKFMNFGFLQLVFAGITQRQKVPMGKGKGVRPPELEADFDDRQQFFGGRLRLEALDQFQRFRWMIKGGIHGLEQDIGPPIFVSFPGFKEWNDGVRIFKSQPFPCAVQCVGIQSPDPGGTH